jgi:putative SOS response-associated peptidase YedK
VFRQYKNGRSDRNGQQVLLLSCYILCKSAVWKLSSEWANFLFLQKSMYLGSRGSLCVAVLNTRIRRFISRNRARLPVWLRDGNVTWITWGRRKDEAIGKFTNGGWARLDSIKSGKWKPWHPRPVLIVAEQFMERDHDDQSCSVLLDTRMVIQGLLAERDKGTRVYLVTIDAPPEYVWMHDSRCLLLAAQDVHGQSGVYKRYNPVVQSFLQRVAKRKITFMSWEITVRDWKQPSIQHMSS